MESQVPAETTTIPTACKVVDSKLCPVKHGNKETTTDTANTETEEDRRQRLRTNIPSPAEKKRCLTALLAATTREFQKTANLPLTGNTMAKCKYNDFKTMWEVFCETASEPELAKYERKFLEICQGFL